MKPLVGGGEQIVMIGAAMGNTKSWLRSRGTDPSRARHPLLVKGMEKTRGGDG